jgi:hypothetical protein
MPNPRSEWRSMLDELVDDDSDKMNAWESEFIDSLVKQFEEANVADRDWEPTDKQWATLDKIYTKVFG